jgi:hypothetical protein
LSLVFILRCHELGGICSTHGDMKNAYAILLRRRQGKRPLRRHSRRRKDYLKNGFERNGSCVNCMDRVQQRDLVNTIRNHGVPKYEEFVGQFCDY